MTDKIFRTFLVEAEYVEQFRILASSWPDGAGMFKRECKHNEETPDNETISYYLSTGFVSESVANILPYTSYSQEEPVYHQGNLHILLPIVNQYLLDQNPNATPITEEYATELLSHIDISDQPYQQAMERLNLTFVHQ